MLPGDINDAVFLAKQEVAGTQMLTYGEYRKVARALVETKAELDRIKREQCPAQAKPHVRRGNDPQCIVCLAEIKP